MSVSVMFHFMYTDYFSSVSFANWPPFGKELLTRLTVCSLCMRSTRAVPKVCGQHG